MKNVLYTKDPGLEVSPGHGGQRVFFELSPIRRGGALSGAAAIIADDR